MSSVTEGMELASALAADKNNENTFDTVCKDMAIHWRVLFELSIALPLS